MTATERYQYFHDWMVEYIGQTHPDKDDPCRQAVAIALAAAYAEWFEPAMDDELEPEEEA